MKNIDHALETGNEGKKMEGGKERARKKDVWHNVARRERGHEGARAGWSGEKEIRERKRVDERESEVESQYERERGRERERERYRPSREERGGRGWRDGGR